MTIEECLKVLVKDIGVETSDKSILESIYRQNAKGTALTDRQCELVKNKLLLFVNEFNNLGIDIEVEVELGVLERPLRSIDRSKYIKIVSHADVVGGDVYESYKLDWKWIEIRFPFSKKLIQKINSIVISHREYFHRKGSHQHFYKLSEINVYKILKVFKNSKFEIQQELLDIYTQVIDILDSKEQYIPSFVNGKLYNINNKCMEQISQHVDINDKLKIVDRKKLFGIQHVDCVLPNNLAGNIASREEKHVLVKPSLYSLNDVSEACLSLGRFPILVLIDDHLCLEQLDKVYTAFKSIVPNSKQTVLFRLDNDAGGDEFNRYIHNNNLNNWLDDDTEIVYIKKSKLPKLLLKSQWSPMCVLTLLSVSPRRHVNTYISETDLIICYDEEMSIFTGRYNGIMQTYN